MKNQGIGLIIFCIFTTTVHAGVPLWSFSPNESPIVSVSATGTTTTSYTIINNSIKPHRLVLSSKTPPGITQLGGPCILPGKSPANPTPSCILNLLINGSALPANNVSGGPILCQANPNNTPNSNQCYQPSPGDTLVITRTTAPGTTTLSTSIALLALSVNNTALNPALTGNARQITITNTGVNPTTSLNIVYSALPAGTTASSTCGTTLVPGASCIITVTPGANATSDCNTGIAPTPGTITVSATNVATAVISNVVILSYGCQYQGGFLYAVDDATAITGSIGGKVVSLVDQAAPFLASPQPTSIIWSSNGNGGGGANASFVTILGIDEISTTSAPSPIVPPYPPGTPPFIACNGSSDGACDSTNIVSYYNFNRTSGGPAPTPVSFYAAGLCTQTINGFSDWYLPAICEMQGSNPFCPLEDQSMLADIFFLIGNANSGSPSTSCNPPSGTECLAGTYWSSTEDSVLPQFAVWAQRFSNGGFSLLFAKSNQFGVRCSRALIP